MTKKRFACFLGLLTLSLAIAGAGNAIFGQSANKKTPEQFKAALNDHQAEFDYLLGDWEFVSISKEWGKGQGFWSAVQIAEGPQILDEFRSISADGKTVYYASSTLRSYNALLERWEIVTAEAGTGLQNMGTAKRVGVEMQIEQKFGAMTGQPADWRIRYFNIKPDSFSWTADRSLDGGKTWEKEYQTIEASRIGPARRLGQLAPARAPGKANGMKP